MAIGFLCQFHGLFSLYQIRLLLYENTINSAIDVKRANLLLKSQKITTLT